MANSNIQSLPYVARKPVTVEREHPDRLVIEGVRFSGDYFRAMADPEPHVLYAIKRDIEGTVAFIQIRNVEEAKAFFAENAGG